jgi:hypothetical protein
MSNVSIGSVYAIGDRIPSFEVLSSFTGKNSIRIYFGSESIDIEEVIDFLKSDSEQILASDNFFKTYSWLENHIATIRTIFRESYISKNNSLESNLKSKLGIFIYDEFPSLHEAVIRCKDATSLFEIEEIIDDAFFEILNHSISWSEVNKKGYVRILKDQHEITKIYRKEYLRTQSDEKSEDDDVTTTDEVLIKLLNQSILTGDEVFLTLRLVHRLKLFAYNLRIIWNGLDSSLMINYDSI